MTTLLRRPKGTTGKVHEITPATAGWGYVGFGLFRLVPGETVAEPTSDTEVILVLVEGRARLGVHATVRTHRWYRRILDHLLDLDRLGDRLRVRLGHLGQVVEGLHLAPFVEIVIVDDIERLGCGHRLLGLGLGLLCRCRGLQFSPGPRA